MLYEGESYCEMLGRLRRHGDREVLQGTMKWLNNRGRVDSLPIISEWPSRQASYVAMRLDGVSHNLAEMFALGQPPMANTDREFLEGHCNGNQFEKTPQIGDYYRKVATRGGQETKGKVYLSGLAAFPGDPRAWVSDRGEVKRLLDERGWGAEGSVNAKITKVGQPMNKGLADDIVDDAVDDLIEANPGAAESRREDLVEKVCDKLKPHWSD